MSWLVDRPYIIAVAEKPPKGSEKGEFFGDICQME
jgi:hypothetical protein